MTTYPLTIKWGKETVQISQFDVAAGVKGLKRELEEQTGVPADRMKLMAKAKGLWKGVLKDDMDLSSFDWAGAASKSGVVTGSGSGNGSSSGNGSGSGNGIPLLLMGSAAGLTGPKTKTVFLEDLPPEEVAKVQDPAGLVNAGNTCYLNAVVQCLRVIPALRQGLTHFTPLSVNSNRTALQNTGTGIASGAAFMTHQTQQEILVAQHNRQMMVRALHETLQRMDRQADALEPAALLHATLINFPQFAQTRNSSNIPKLLPGQQAPLMQQDAEEFYSAVLSVLAEEITGLESIRRGFQGIATIREQDLMGATNLVDAIFGIKMKEIMTCDELDSSAPSTFAPAAAATGSEESKTAANDPMDTTTTMDTSAVAAATTGLIEPPVVRFDLQRKLVCSIQGGATTTTPLTSATSNLNAAGLPLNVTHIMEGLQLSLTGKIEKNSNMLGRDAVWTSRKRIARLPPILTVQFERFYWKATPDSADHAGVKCKIMKPVAFNSMLDVYEFCTPEIQTILKISRDKAQAIEDERMNQKLQGQSNSNNKSNKTQEGDGTDGGGGDGGGVDDTSMDTDERKPPNATTTMDDDTQMDTITASGDAAVAKAGGDDDDDDNNEEAAALQAALAMSMEPELSPIGPGLPDNFQGLYELFAVVTHKGRDADGGHYMAWVKADHGPGGGGSITATAPEKIADTDENNEDWYVFDDDMVSPCKTEDVLKLKGGGDWHMSYLNFYRAKK